MDDQNEIKDLTEQLKKGELEGRYYIKTKTGESIIFYIDYDSYMYIDIEEVLAPVPSYEEWQELGNKYDSLQERLYAQAPIHAENQQLKELLKEILADADLSYCANDIELRIDKALGEKK